MKRLPNQGEFLDVRQSEQQAVGRPEQSKWLAIQIVIEDALDDLIQS
jgi:hypothetical protein